MPPGRVVAKQSKAGGSGQVAHPMAQRKITGCGLPTQDPGGAPELVGTGVPTKLARRRLQRRRRR